jgi:hypothetical protein
VTTATVILTAALVLITAYYAWTNRRVLEEMGAAREAAVLPKLALEFHRLGPTVVDLAIRSVGPGAALDIDVAVEWVPADEDAKAPTIRWRRNLLSPGEQVELFPPGDLNGNLDTLPTIYRDIRLRGSMEDVLGKSHTVDEAFGNITEWRDLLGDAHESWKPPEPERRLAEALGREFKSPLTGLGDAAKEGLRLLRGPR